MVCLPENSNTVEAILNHLTVRFLRQRRDLLRSLPHMFDQSGLAAGGLGCETDAPSAPSHLILQVNPSTHQKPTATK